VSGFEGDAWIASQLTTASALQLPLVGGAMPFNVQQLLLKQMMAVAASLPSQQMYQQILPSSTCPDEGREKGQFKLFDSSQLNSSENLIGGNNASSTAIESKYDKSLLCPDRSESHREKRSKSLDSRPLAAEKGGWLHGSSNESGKNSAIGSTSQSETDTEREKSLSQSVSCQDSSGSSQCLDSPCDADQVVQAILSKVSSIESTLMDHRAKIRGTDVRDISYKSGTNF